MILYNTLQRAMGLRSFIDIGLGLMFFGMRAMIVSFNVSGN